jgi:hypothetical protein
MIHEATIVNTRRKDGRTNMQIKKPYAAVQDIIFMKAVDRTDQYHSFYSVQKSKVHELPARGRKILDIRSSELKEVQF